MDEQLTINGKRMELVRRLEQFDEMTQQRAVVAFVQFKSMTGQRRFLKGARVGWFKRTFKKKEYEDKKFKGQWLDIRRAPEPEVVLWQNQHITNKTRYLRGLLVALICFIMLSLCLTLVSIAQYFQEQSEEKYDT